MSTKKRLTEQQANFLADWGHLIRTYKVQTFADIFGVTEQAISYHINKRKDKHENL